MVLSPGRSAWNSSALKVDQRGVLRHWTHRPIVKNSECWLKIAKERGHISFFSKKSNMSLPRLALGIWFSHLQSGYVAELSGHRGLKHQPEHLDNLGIHFWMSKAPFSILSKHHSRNTDLVSEICTLHTAGNGAKTGFVVFPLAKSPLYCMLLTSSGSSF